MNIIYKWFSFLILLILFGCNKEGNIYESKVLNSEIEELILQIIELDSLDKNYPEYRIFNVLPKYINRLEKETFRPGPPPGSKTLFPDLKFETRENKITFSETDFHYFARQEIDSRRIELSEQYFGKKLLTKLNPEDQYIYFSIPVFNKKRTIAWIKTGFYCGSLCGEGKTLILMKNNSKWNIIWEKRNWTS